MPKRLLDYDATTGVATYHEYDHARKKTIIGYEWDSSALIERNKALQNMGNGGARGLNEYSKQGIKKNWWHVADLDTGVMLKLWAEHRIDIMSKEGFARFRKLILNDPEWRYLRTGTGRV